MWTLCSIKSQREDLLFSPLTRWGMGFNHNAVIGMWEKLGEPRSVFIHENIYMEECHERTIISVLLLWRVGPMLPTMGPSWPHRHPSGTLLFVFWPIITKLFNFYVSNVWPSLAQVHVHVHLSHYHWIRQFILYTNSPCPFLLRKVVVTQLNLNL